MLGRTPAAAALLLILCVCLAHDAQAGQLKQQIEALQFAATRGALRTAASRGPASQDCTKLTADNKNVYWSSDVLKKGSSLSSMARDMYLCDEWKSNDGTRCALVCVRTASCDQGLVCVIAATTTNTRIKAQLEKGGWGWGALFISSVSTL